MNRTNIEWTIGPDGKIGFTWNPLVGCTPAMLNGQPAEECRNCYARTAHRMRHTAYMNGNLQLIQQYARPFSEIQEMPDRLTGRKAPESVKRPATVFVCSVSDLFHEAVSDAFRMGVFAAMARAPWHRYVLCTKRPQIAAEFLSRVEGWPWPRNAPYGFRRKDSAAPAAEPHFSVVKQANEPVF